MHRICAVRIYHLFFLLLIACFFLCTKLFAAAFQFYELGTPIIGTATVGQAVVDDASAVYFNPSSMTQLQRSQFLLGSQLLLPYINFRSNNRTTIRGGDGGDAALLTPGLDMYYVYSLTPALKFGVSLTSPYGGYLDYDDDWVGRFIVQNVQFYTLNLNPGIAYRINSWLSLGVGFALEYINLNQTVALPITRLIAGQANLKVHDLSAGFNAGILFSPTSSTQVGVAYRSKINHRMHGHADFLDIAVTPNVITQLTMPQTVMLSVVQGVSRQFSLIGEAGWANWAVMKNTMVRIRNFTLTAPIDWHNTYRIGLGAQYRLAPCLLLQLGGSYDSSPTKRSKRLPDLPMDRQIRIGTGVIYTLMNVVRLGLSYEYLNLGHAPINNISTNGAFSGSYWRDFANTLQVSIDIDF